MSVARRDAELTYVQTATIRADEEWSCVERLRLREVNAGAFGRLWCYLDYGFCRLGCIDPPIIAV